MNKIVKKEKRIFVGLSPKKLPRDLTARAGGAGKWVFVGLSGGVDSSVAAALLKKEGYDVVGISMRFWRDGAAGQNACCSAEAEASALAVAQKLGLPFYIFNFEREFKKAVVGYFLAELEAGRTPNPCVVCNPEIKFGLFLERARRMGADFVATGHYARIAPVFDAARNDKNILFKLFAAKDRLKDQSYFLHGLTQEQLSRVLFPLADYTKAEVYKLAKQWRLPHQARQSFDICFAADYPGFLKKHLKLKPGKIIGPAGREIGRHEGLALATIGQRAGIGGPGPFYVVEKYVKKNLLRVSNNERDLYRGELLVEKANWLAGRAPALPLKCRVKIRSGGEAAEAEINDRPAATDRRLRIKFKKPQRAVTPGQSAVFYGRRGEVLGGGRIV